MSFDLIYLEPNSGGYHIGHCKIFLARALDDIRVRSIHFVIERTLAPTPGLIPWSFPDIPRRLVTSTSLKNSPNLLTRESLTPFRRGLALWKEARRLITERPGSICFINLFDPTMFGSIFDREPLPGVITGILHFPPFKLAIRRSPLANLCRWIIRSAPHYLANYRTMPLVFTFDEHYLNILPRFVSRHWRLVPDPVPLPRQLLLSAFPAGVDSPRPVRTKFLLFGSLGRRKGVGRLLEALHQMDQNELEKIHIILAGEIREATNEERQELAHLIEAARRLPGLSLEHIDRYRSEEDLIWHLNDCHVVLAPHANHIG